MKKADFIKDEKFWCSKCDQHLVDSNNPETGTFYSVTGHVYIGNGKTGDPTTLIYALCPSCDK